MTFDDLLDIQRLKAHTGLVNIEYHETLDSTQTLAHELAAGDSSSDSPLLIVAEQQTAGRGRGTNTWWTGPGSLAMSLLFDPRQWGLERRAQPLRSLAVGVAIVEVVSELLAAQVDGLFVVGLHWPNDVF